MPRVGVEDRMTASAIGRASPGRAAPISTLGTRKKKTVSKKSCDNDSSLQSANTYTYNNSRNSSSSSSSNNRKREILERRANYMPPGGKKTKKRTLKKKNSAATASTTRSKTVDHSHTNNEYAVPGSVPFLPAGQKQHSFNVLASVSESFRMNGVSDMEYKVSTRKGSLIPVISPPRKGGSGKSTLRVRMPLVIGGGSPNFVEKKEVEEEREVEVEVEVEEEPKEELVVPGDLLNILAELEGELDEMTHEFGDVVQIEAIRNIFVKAKAKAKVKK